jgi:Ca-activated chloride channel homolog
MSKGRHFEPDEDCTLHFRWRWGEHGIYLGVCSTVGVCVLLLHILPLHEKQRRCAADLLDFIRADYRHATAVKPSAEETIGSLHKGSSGRMGLHPLKGHRTKEEMIGRARSTGILGVMRSNDGGHLASILARDTAAGSNVAGLLGQEVGEGYGVGGLGLVGTGTGGGGVGHRHGLAGSSSNYSPVGGYANRASGPGLGHAGGQAFAPQTVSRLAESPAANPHAPVIDPNGRFATTYRPGHGHLDWFDAELGRHKVPPQIRQLVGDLGSRYAPDVPAPEDRALVQQIDLERTALAPGGGLLNMRITLRSSKERVDAQRLRPPLSVHVVLDVSGSMNGEPLEQAKRAVQQLLQRLVPTDRFSLTTFHTLAQVVVPDGSVGARRELIRQTIEQIQTGGSTNMAEGLDLGYGEAKRHRLDPEWVSLVMLLSDGYPNAGEAWPEALSARAAEAFQSGVQTSAFGVSGQHDGLLMSQIAERGAGAYYYLPDALAIPSALAAELDTRLQPVAQAVEVRVRLSPEVRLTATHGSRKLDARESAQVSEQERTVDALVASRDGITRDRMREIEGGMRFFIPGFARDDKHVILLGLQVPPGVGKLPIATVELRYKDRLKHGNMEDRKTVQATYAESDTVSVASLDPSVSATVQGFAAGETLVAASGWIGTIESSRAGAVLAERAELMRKASTALHEPRLANDATRIDHLRQVIVGGEVRDPILLAQLLSHSGQGLLH